MIRTETSLKRLSDFPGPAHWAKGYCVSTVGLDEQVIRAYIRHQEAEERRLEQLHIQGL